MEMPQYKKIKSMLKAIQSAIANDVATESTSQEILKKVNNNSKKVVANYLNCNSTIPPSGTRTLLEVSGKGCLHYAVSVQEQWSKNLTTRTLKITVDGQVICNIQHSHTDSSTTSTVTLGMVNKNYCIEGVGSAGLVRFPVDDDFTGSNSFNTAYLTCIPQSDELFKKTTSANGTDYTELLWMNNDIEFETSLLIEETCSSAGYSSSDEHGVAINYSLYE